MNNQIVTLLSTHPVLMNTIQAGYSLANDWADGEAEMRLLLDSSPRPLYIIDDIRQMQVSLDDLIVAASLGGRGQTPIWRHPNALGIYFISDSKAVEIAARGMHSPIFGNMQVKVCHTLEDALADIEQTVAT